MEDGKKVSVVKLGEFKLNDTSVLVINKTDYSGEDRIDFRVWVNSMKYKGPTKQGFVLTMDKMDDFIELVLGMKEKLAGVERPKKAANPAVKKKKSKKLQ